MYPGSTQTAQSVDFILEATVGGVAVAVLLTIIVVVVALLLIYWIRATNTQKK